MDLVHGSGRVLQALSFQPTGAIVAAATTSLPEGAGGERNWDYRYSWVRDSCFTMQALWVAACPDEAVDFFSFLTSAAATVDGQHGLQIMFGVGGEHDLTERTLPHLEGWRDSRPVRVGNGAWNQQQVDVYGELLGAAHQLRDYLEGIDETTRGFLVACADAAAVRWREADQGIWEVRGEPRHFLYSKVMCWVALDRAIAMAGLLQAEDRVDGWKRTRDEIHQTVLEGGWSETAQAFTQSFGSDELDASNLMLAIVGFLPPTDPRMLATIDAIDERLTDERGLVYRYRTEGRRRRPRRRGGHVPALHVLARRGPGSRRAGRTRPAGVRPGRSVLQRRRPARRRGRPGQRRTARQLPAGVQPHRARERRVGDLPGRRNVLTPRPDSSA